MEMNAKETHNITSSLEKRAPNKQSGSILRLDTGWILKKSLESKRGYESKRGRKIQDLELEKELRTRLEQNENKIEYKDLRITVKTWVFEINGSIASKGFIDKFIQRNIECIKTNVDKSSERLFDEIRKPHRSLCLLRSKKTLESKDPLKPKKGNNK
jgi:hypothetical protein